MGLEGKIVAVTGASAGVGRATAREFAARGADVGLIARGEDRLRAAAREIEQMGRRACVAPADVADADAVEAAAARIEAELGPIDVWVNVAMTAVLAELWDCRPEEFLRVTQVTYLGSIHGIQAALRRFRPRDRGVIVQVGSALSRRGIPLQSTYCGSKHAIKGALDSLRAELLHEGSHVKVALVQIPGDRLGGRAPAARAVGRAADRLHDPRRARRLRADGPLPGPDQHPGTAVRRADRPGAPPRQPAHAAAR
jgi:NADP-dependent 3-hydroxy acid dehydrogenase YdfG